MFIDVPFLQNVGPLRGTLLRAARAARSEINGIP